MLKLGTPFSKHPFCNVFDISDYLLHKHFRSYLFVFPLAGALLVKYDNHETGSVASSYKCFICFQLATTTGPIDLEEEEEEGGAGRGWSGGVCSLPMAPTVSPVHLRGC